MTGAGQKIATEPACSGHEEDMSKSSIRVPVIILAALAAAAAVYFALQSPEGKQAKKPEKRFSVTEETKEFKTRTGQLAGKDIPPASPEELTPPATDEAAKPEPGTATPQQEQKQEEPAAPAEDSVVRPSILLPLADRIIAAYEPQGSTARAQKAPASSLSFKGLNQYFGRTLEGFAFTEAEDIRKARREIFSHLFTPGVVQAIYDAYAAQLTEIMIHQAVSEPHPLPTASGGKTMRPLSAEELPGLFSANAPILRRTAAALRAVAEHPEILEAAVRYDMASAQVEVANARFQATLGEDDGKPGPDSEVAGRQLKNAIVNRERIRSGIIGGVREACGKDCPSDAEIFYIVRFAQRRVQTRLERVPLLSAMADRVDALAGLFESKARELTGKQ